MQFTTPKHVNGKQRMPTPEEMAGWNPQGSGVDEPAPRPSLEIFPIADLIENFPTLREPVIHGIARRSETLNIIGDPKSCKSWLAMNLALTIATGGIWLGRYQCQRGRVLYCDNELNREDLAYRFREVAAAMSLFPVDYTGMLDVVSLRGKLRSFNEMLLDLIDVPQGQYVAMLFDARYRFCTGESDENSNNYQTNFYNAADTLGQRTGALIGFVHHLPKGSSADRKITDLGAGGGAQARATDAHVALRPHEDDGVYVLDGVVRSFPPLSPLPVRWAFPLWEPELDADPAKLKGRLTATEQRQGERDREAQDKIFAALRDHGPSTPRQLRGLTGLSRERLQRLLDGLESSGNLTAETATVRGNESKTYSIPKEPF